VKLLLLALVLGAWRCYGQTDGPVAGLLTASGDTFSRQLLALAGRRRQRSSHGAGGGGALGERSLHAQSRCELSIC